MDKPLEVVRGAVAHGDGAPRVTHIAQRPRIRVCVLGTVSIRGPGRPPVPIGAMQQKIFLSLLVAYGDRSLSVDRIAEELWGEDRPGRWLAAIRTLANSLRRVAGDRDFVYWTGRGYQLHRHSGAVESDVDDMLAATEKARVALLEGRVDDAEAAARWALSCYGSGPWTTDCWYWGDLAADAFYALGQALLAKEHYLRCLIELSRVPEDLDWHDGVTACLRHARREAAAAGALPATGGAGPRAASERDPAPPVRRAAVSSPSWDRPTRARPRPGCPT